ncbi:hypothetical protein [Streptomyces xanthochromogenes]|uniref:hypothetical protein n=2 Tax=Streptomyces xanthochromogenes TaxID=67384 RepID=UPI002F4301F6
MMTTLQPTPELSASTRMLLACDGSTTLLLQALTGHNLSIRVDAQGDTPAGRLPRGIRSALGLVDTSVVLERRSCLVTSEQEVVSINRVVFDGAARKRMGVPDSLTPIGLQLRDQQVHQHREQLSTGLMRWRDSLTERWVDSAFKEYVIHYAAGGRAYVHEQFNPHMVHLADA